jgi:beta-galactosidase
MEKNILFPKIGGLLHGGDYNPEQWLNRPDILKKDIEMMKKAGMNSVTLGVFSWSVYEPKEGEYHFDWLEERMDALYQEGIYTILATPSGARPAWLDVTYPEALRVNNSGHRNHHGVRHNHCMSSPVYREKTALINRKLADRFGKHPGLIMWHISNELGGECYCPLCIKRFQNYLKEKFQGDIEALNEAWWTTFWSHRYNNFEQIEPPFSNGEGSIMGLNLEWRRFTTWNMTDFMKTEIKVVKSVTPDIPVTTNFMKLYNGLNYQVMAKEVDVISWDSYPKFHNEGENLSDTMAENAFDHAVMRSMKKDKPFMLMESAPGLVNWHPFNKLKRPGAHRLASLQAIACGSDTVQYFQWRKSRGSFEQYHGAVIDHLGTDDTRIFREVEEVGSLLKAASEVAGTTISSKCALIFDWDNRWAIQDMKGLGQSSKKYEETCLQLWKELFQRGIEAEVISSESSLLEYDVVIAPMLYLLKPGTADRLKEFVSKGGQLLATYLTGYVDQNTLCYLEGFPGDGLSELFGIISEEIDTLYPADRNRISFGNGITAEVFDYAEILRVKGAAVLASYEEDFYKGTGAVTCNSYGQGKAYYIGARISAEDTTYLLDKIFAKTGIQDKMLPQGVEYHKRTGENNTFEFYLNYNTESVILQNIHGKDILTGEHLDGEVRLQGYQVIILKMI